MIRRASQWQCGRAAYQAVPFSFERVKSSLVSPFRVVVRNRKQQQRQIECLNAIAISAYCTSQIELRCNTTQELE